MPGNPARLEVQGHGVEASYLDSAQTQKVSESLPFAKKNCDFSTEGALLTRWVINGRASAEHY